MSQLQRSVGNRTLQRALAPRKGEPTSQPGYLLSPRRGERDGDTDKDKKGDEAEVTGGGPIEAGRETSNSLTGREWAERFPTSKELSDLDSNFAARVRRYLEALRKAGAKVEILATKRPKERTYLMHWAWQIARGGYDPRKIPPMPRLNIEWWRGESARSKIAAQEILDALGIEGLREPPALISHHNEGKAIDLRISWAGDLTIKDGRGVARVIASMPRDETNKDLIAVGMSYGVFHAVEVEKEKVHWSVDGR